ncbi:MAG: prepilin-type N-terminal cleavage/methylation domain-containing protein [Thalassotalea sp.]
MKVLAVSFSTSSQVNKGFTLIEVMVALMLSAIALLGLAAAQIKSLQYSTNSFQYTVSLIQANNTVEKFWVDLCDIQQGVIEYNDEYKAILAPNLPNYSLTLPADFSNNFQLSVEWNDDRVTDGLENKIQLNVSFPQLPADC